MPADLVPTPEDGAGDHLPGWLPGSYSVDRIVYTTITLMSVLIVYDGWEHLRIVAVVGVVVGPVLAMVISHTFAALIALQTEAGGGPGRGDRLRIVRREVLFLLFCVPPLVMLLGQYLLGVSITQAIRVTLWVGVASLAWWGYVAGRRSRRRGWGLVVAVAAGLAVGLVVLLLQVFLQPGRLVAG